MLSFLKRLNKSVRPQPKPIAVDKYVAEIAKAFPMTAGRKDGFTQVLEYALRNNYRTSEIAYMLATIWHETARWMQPIREGAVRYGTNYTDAQSRAAVKAIFDKGIIRTNYALPINGRSYYGRGLIQITWIDNYRKFEPIVNAPLVDQPDLALEWFYALPIAFIGCRDGLFRGKKLSMLPDRPTHAQWTAARDIVNGDTRLNGANIARDAEKFYQALLAGAK